ncbi:bifunctional glutamate N-acetyltransferase/amino-acid acetyltransferase ArgJ [bacterium]|nr:bifunctional glutamate N-acetyltransferase/amino-acid acetyltransferase ArgJ [bacterium]
MRETITDVRGFLAWGAYTGIKSKRRDLALIYSEVPASAAAVFTQNMVVAEPVKISRKHIKQGRAQLFVINAGNANACTGEQGRLGAQEMVDTAAKTFDLDPKHIIIASTGVIGRKFPTEKVVKGIIKNASKLTSDPIAGTLAANAILTTDTFAKESYSRAKIGKHEIRMAGIAKGSGMIHPNMATMLGFIVTDAAITPPLLDEALRECVNESFNMITVDGDTSTNDMVAVMANGQSGMPEIKTKGKAYKAFREELMEHCVVLASQIVSDGEGSTRLIQYDVEGAPNKVAARQIARTISDSNLVKTAFFGRDPNWGRIVAAAGRAGVSYNPDKTDLFISTEKRTVQLLENGQPVKWNARTLKSMMRAIHLFVRINLKSGKGRATAWGSDLSYEYVRINAEYTT